MLLPFLHAGIKPKRIDPDGIERAENGDDGGSDAGARSNPIPLYPADCDDKKETDTGEQKIKPALPSICAKEHG